MKNAIPLMKWIFRAGASLAIAFLVYHATVSGKPPVQPIVYSHKAHVETAGLGCTECHVSAQSAASASLPGLELCATCHGDQPISESPEEKKLLEFVRRGQAVPWLRVYRVPDHVYFSHRRHVTKAGIECKICHGDVAELIVPAASAFLPVTMENCMECHRQNNASTDCLACHR